MATLGQPALAVQQQTHIVVLHHGLIIWPSVVKQKKTCKFAQIDPSISLSAESSACCPV